MTNRKIALLLLCGIASCQLLNAQNNRSASNAIAHRLSKLPPGADGAYQTTTKGGARYVAYPPLDEFGSTTVEQMRLWWVTEPWHGDDKPYAQARNTIDAAVKRGAKPLALVSRYKSELKDDPWDPLKVYRWAYASWLAQKAAQTGNEAQRILNPVGEYMPEARFPGSYQYARLAFLVQANTGPRHALKHVGDKLLRRNPADEEVKYAMVNVLTVGKYVRLTSGALENVYDARDDARALAYLGYFRKKYPRKQSYDVRYAMTFEYLWRRPSRNPFGRKKAQQAIAAYQAFLRKHPNSPYRAWALASIKGIQTGQQDWELRDVRRKMVEDANRRARQRDQRIPKH